MTHRARSRGRLDQGGFTLIETITALMLVSILVLALIRGLLTTVKADGSTNRVQKVNASLHSFSESLKELNYEPCADSAWYQAVFTDAMAGVAVEDRKKTFGVSDAADVTVVRVEYWSGSNYPVNSSKEPISRDLGEYVADCGTDTGTQKITFQVKFNKTIRTGQVVKRNPAGLGYDDYIAPSTTLAAGNTPPRASFTVTTDGPGAFTFTSTSYDPGGSITAAAWDFGDGSLPGSGNVVSRTYGPGIFKIRLTVTDNEGASTSATQTVTVLGTPPVPTGLKLVRVRHGGGTSASYDFTWNKIPGVQRYELRLQWCINWPIFGYSCYGQEYHQFGDTGGGTLSNSFPYVPFYKASIRAQVGSEWSDWSPEISGWAP